MKTFDKVEIESIFNNEVRAIACASMLSCVRYYIRLLELRTKIGDICGANEQVRSGHSSKMTEHNLA